MLAQKQKSICCFAGFRPMAKRYFVVSSELPELIMLCSRILVLSRGRLVGEVCRHDFDEERILSLAYSEYLASNHHQEDSSN